MKVGCGVITKDPGASQSFFTRFMASLKLLTWNLRVMNDKIKRSAVFSFLKKQRADIMVLIETHIDGCLQMALKCPWVGWAYHSAYTSHCRGVTVLIAKSIHFELQGSRIDPFGSFVFLHVVVYVEPMLILAMYIPPPFNSTLISEGLGYMALFPAVTAIWLGDFNIALIAALTGYRLHHLHLLCPCPLDLQNLLSFSLLDT